MRDLFTTYGVEKTALLSHGTSQDWSTTTSMADSKYTSHPTYNLNVDNINNCEAIILYNFNFMIIVIG